MFTMGGSGLVSAVSSVSGRLSTRWIEHHAGESGKPLTRENRIKHDRGSPFVTILQALVMRRGAMGLRNLYRGQ